VHAVLVDDRRLQEKLVAWFVSPLRPRVRIAKPVGSVMFTARPPG
jgi:hypothetical protein